MATLSVSAGALTATRTTSNTNALVIINAYIKANNGPVGGTNQEKLEWYIDDLVKHTLSIANARDLQESVEAARVAKKTELDQRGWA